MCQQLFQHYACGHSKSVCLTSCPHAVDTGTWESITESSPSLSRSCSMTCSATPPPNASITSPPISTQRWSAGTLFPSTPLATPSNPALPEEGYNVAPNFCSYYFPRDLPQSNHPCIDCYFLPEWTHLADRYVRVYAEGHPSNKKEDAEQMSGMKRMREEFEEKQGKQRKEREGKLNVFVDGEEGFEQLDWNGK